MTKLYLWFKDYLMAEKALPYPETPEFLYAIPSGSDASGAFMTRRRLTSRLDEYPRFAFQRQGRCALCGFMGPDDRRRSSPFLFALPEERLQSERPDGR